MASAYYVGEGWEIDYKSNRVIAKVEKNGQYQVDFSGTLINYEGRDTSDLKIEIKILNDGVIPIDPEGGSFEFECYGTKIVYAPHDFGNGDTTD